VCTDHGGNSYVCENHRCSTGNQLLIIMTNLQQFHFSLSSLISRIYSTMLSDKSKQQMLTNI
ncbi:MAG: hypothetical protein ACJ72T_11305, partial [Nitrososphaeraceae archaeon]